MASEQFTNLVAMLPPPSGPETPTDDLRAGYALLGSLFPNAEGVTATEGQLGGVPTITYRPADLATGEGGDGVGAGERTVVWFHGGGFVIGGAAVPGALCSHLALQARAVVHSVDYRLAPEHPYPAATDDAIAAYRGALTTTAADRLVIGGDSAGGGLALTTLLRAGEAGDPIAAGAVLLSPWVDLTLSGDSVSTVTDDAVLTSALLEHWAGLYVDGGEATATTDPLVSPLRAELGGLPPLLVQAGTREVLRDDAVRLAERARSADVEVDLDIADGMIHQWQLFAGTPEADAAIEGIASWIMARTL